jgi:hypothetical protein
MEEGLQGKTLMTLKNDHEHSSAFVLQFKIEITTVEFSLV